MDVNLLEFKKLPLRKYPEILSVLAKVQEKTNALTASGSMDSIVKNLPQIIKEAYPEFVELINVITDVDKSVIEEWGLDDLVIVVEKLIEVNRFGFVFEQLKKMMAGKEKEAITLSAVDS